MSFIENDAVFTGNGIQELSVEELDEVGGAVNWYGVGRVLGTAVRLGAVGGGVGILAAGAVVGGALAIDYALDGEIDMIK